VHAFAAHHLHLLSHGVHNLLMSLVLPHDHHIATLLFLLSWEPRIAFQLEGGLIHLRALWNKKRILPLASARR